MKNSSLFSIAKKKKTPNSKITLKHIGSQVINCERKKRKGKKKKEE